MSYPQIEDGLQRIIEDHGKENTASAKRAELYVHDATVNGYRNVQGEQVQPNGEFAYRGQTLEQLQELNTRLDNAYTGDPVKDAAIIRNQEIVQNLMRKTPPTPVPDIRPRLKRPEPAQDIPPQVEQTAQEVPEIVQDEPKEFKPDWEQVQPTNLDTVPEDVLEFYDKATKNSKLDIAIVDGLPDVADGCFHNGMIYMNANKVNDAETVKTVFSHELFHAMAKTNGYDSMINLAIDYNKALYRAEGLEVTREDLIEMMRREYADASNGQMQLSDDDAIAELGAQFMSDVVTDEGLIDRLDIQKNLVLHGKSADVERLAT